MRSTTNQTEQPVEDLQKLQQSKRCIKQQPSITGSQEQRLDKIGGFQGIQCLTKQQAIFNVKS
jgi:hypothetical protein